MSNADEAMSPAEFAKLMGAYPQPAENPLPAYGGYMDNSAANFAWVNNNDYFGAESNGDQVKLFYEGIYYNDDEEDEREGQEIESYSLVSKQDYMDYYHDTKYNPCKCDEQGCLSCFLDEAPHTPALKKGGISSYESLWFEDDELNALDAETFEATPKWECDACGDMHDDEDEAESCCIESCDHTGDAEMQSWGGPYRGSEFQMYCNNCGADGYGTFGSIDWSHHDGKH